jgi:hypothetical protein
VRPWLIEAIVTPSDSIPHQGLVEPRDRGVRDVVAQRDLARDLTGLEPASTPGGADRLGLGCSERPEAGCSPPAALLGGLRHHYVWN